jgi:NAD(P)-dependent dehydrogenase (short-subunit alcohol dehydrogenase family)
MWETAENIAKKEGRLDICVANAGILRGFECLEYPAEEFRKVDFLDLFDPAVETYS